MKILAIRLKNLASIEGSFEVDFTAEPLASAGIFAISGPTGAGKSTVLDALCLALYDKTPRFAATGENQFLRDVGEAMINQSDVRNILRRGTGEGYAEVDFLGATGRRYRSRWSVRRARGKATGSLQAQTIQACDLDTDTELQGTKTEVLGQLAGLVGLTYEQFTRTVLLAQNDFATFLKSKESAKAELLEKLTGTDIYSRISREIYQRSKLEEEAYKRVKETLGLVELMKPEEWEACVKQKQELTVVREQGVRQLALLTEQLQTLQAFVGQQTLLAQKQKEESEQGRKLVALQEGFDKQRTELDVFRQKVEELQPELNAARELDVKIQSASLTFTEVQASLQKACREREDAERQVAGKQQLVAGLEGQLQAQGLRQRLAKMSAGVTDGVVAEQISFSELSSASAGNRMPEALTWAETLLQTGRQVLLKQRESAEKIKNQLAVFDIKALGSEQAVLLKEQEQLQSARHTFTDWERVSKELRELMLQQNQLKARKQKAGEDVAELETQHRVWQESFSGLQKVYENARNAMTQNVEALRANLLEGEPCPVCGSREHPYEQPSEALDELFQSIQEKYQQEEKKVQEVGNKKSALSGELKQITEQEITVAAQTARLQEQEKQCSLKLSAWKEKAGDEADLLQWLEVALETCRKRGEEINRKVQEYETINKELRQQEEATASLHKECEVLVEAIGDGKLKMQELQAVSERLALLKQTEEREKERFNQADKNLKDFQQQRASLLKGKPIEDAVAAVKSHEAKLVDALEKCRCELENGKLVLSGIQGEIRRLSDMLKELNEKKSLIEEPEQLPGILERQKEVNQENDRAHSAVELKLLQHEQNQKRLQELEKELLEKQNSFLKWEKLNKLIGSADGNKFKVIAQGYTLNLLLLHANKHLSYLSRRYRLQQVPDSLALQVIDGDMCDEVRTVYSLSGGESFLISLALALGLSSLSSNNLQVESLFIDEGFGSLDAESLRMAMEALEMLQMQGRKIGVISHVQEMSERISVQIQVHKSVNGRSQIRVVG